jgi:hypothetical protein
MVDKEKYKKTIGAYAFENALKEPESISLVENANEHLKKWNEIIENALDVGKKGLPHQDFYIDIWVKWEKVLGQKVLRTYPFVKKVCPTPQYDQTLYKYNHKDGSLEYLWTLPDRDTYEWYIDNAAIVHKDRWELLNFVLKDKNGDLLRQAKILNGEPLIEEN